MYSDQKESERLSRMTIECAKYLGEPVGADVPIAEVRLQSKANGYTDEEFDALLANDGHCADDTLTVPQQGDLFGSWPGLVGDTTSNAEPTTSAETDGAGESVETDDRHIPSRVRRRGGWLD